MMTPTLRLGALLVLTSLGCKPDRAPVEAAGDTTSVPAASACGTQADGRRVFRVLHLNDTYRIEGLADGRGGLARVRTLRAELEKDCPGAVVLTHAGDALFPSLLSREFGGAQMIDVLNALDGAPESDDPLMFATFGNHEFDKAKLKHAPALNQRIAESQFTWFDTNIAWKRGEDGPMIAGDNLASERLITVGGVKLGLFGLTIDSKVPAYVESIDTDYIRGAREHSRSLRAQGAEVVIGLTHLDAGSDQEILETLGQEGPDIVLGGHDHVLQSVDVAGRPMLKGDADAVRVRSLEIAIGPDGALNWKVDQAGIALNDDTYARDPQVQARIQGHLDGFERAFCKGETGCLGEVLTKANTTLYAEETKIRRYETNLGDWVADRMLETFPEAQVALVNSGALRLNQDIGAGTPITRQIVEEIFAYPAPMHQIEISGATLLEVLGRSVRDWSGSGHWLQVSGIAFRQDAEAEEVVEAYILGEDGPVPVDRAASYSVVTVHYLLDAGMGDQDGYTMLNLEQIQPVDADGTDLKQVVLEALREAGETGLSVRRAGRICNALQSDAPCLLDR